MNQPHAVHPADGFAKLTEYATQQRLVEMRMAFRVVDNVEKLTTTHVL